MFSITVLSDAFLQVKENRGCAGVDGITIDEFERDLNRNLLVLAREAEVWDGESLKVMDKGIPQGSPISPILANLFLDELDEEMLKNRQRYVRYADDFLVLCKSPDKAKESLEFTNEQLQKLLLKLDEGDVVSFDNGFQYLGVTFVRSMIFVPFDRPKKERKVLYYPPPMNMAAYLLKREKGW